MKKQRGFTIVELMIGITIGLVVITLASVLFSSTLFANANGVKQSQLEQTVHALVVPCQRISVALAMRQLGKPHLPYR